MLAGPNSAPLRDPPEQSFSDRQAGSGTLEPAVKMLDVGFWRPIATESSDRSMGGGHGTDARGTDVGIGPEPLCGTKNSLKLCLH